LSLYRQPGRVAAPPLVLVAVTALVVGLAGGFALGRGTAPEPSLAERIADLRRQLEPAEQGLELTATEYPQAVRAGRVVERTEYQAAQADVNRVKDTVAGARADLRALVPARAAALDRAVGALSSAVDRRAPPAQVRRLSDAGQAALRAAVGR
jgi:hypothetical protein